ncbi:orotidine-5'-phosphate decarboxylase [bacterium]|nr:orotidine-5'-phosphate decarboxylase [bacterium]MBU1983124.1 orotidine-5'-phosphate decarboxylase [bacterium]
MKNAQTQPFAERLRTAIKRAGSPLCVGLDPDPQRIPSHLGEGIAACRSFVKRIIESTHDLVAAFKANTAFFEAYGPDGVALLEEMKGCIGENALLIVDAKRGDVAHTNEAYARVFFGRMRADAVTVQPYLGGEPLEPFLRDPARGAFVLCATSNPGAAEVQNLATERGPLYLEIARHVRTWSEHANIGLVLATTQPEAIKSVLEVAPELPLLLPGGGAQGGRTREVLALLKRKQALGLFTFSRSVIYASSGKDFAEAARRECERLKAELV